MRVTEWSGPMQEQQTDLREYPGKDPNGIIKVLGQHKTQKRITKPVNYCQLKFRFITKKKSKKSVQVRI